MMKRDIEYPSSIASKTMPETRRKRRIYQSSSSSPSDTECAKLEPPRPLKRAREAPSTDKENQDPSKHNGRRARKYSPVTIWQEPVVPAHSISREPHSDLLISKFPGKKEPKPWEYICIHRPFFDVDGENWQQWSQGKAERLEKHDLYQQLYKPRYNEENQKRVFGASPVNHKDHKWVMMRDAWSRYTNYYGREDFYVEFRSHRDMHEVLDEALGDFDKAFTAEGGPQLDEMWAIVSALGLWMNVVDISGLIDTNCEKTCGMVSLIGCALLTVLSAIGRANQLKRDSRFLDLALVIGYYLELSHDLPAYGVESKCVSWGRDAVQLFKKGNLDIKRGLFDTAHRLVELENALHEVISHGSLHEGSDDGEEAVDEELDYRQHSTEQDPWAWSAKVRAHQKRYGGLGPTIRAAERPIMAPRARTAHSRKGPLGDVTTNDLRRNA